MSYVFDWNYRPAPGEFTVNIMSETQTKRLLWMTCPTLFDAVAVWARYSLPMRWMVVAEIIDDMGVVVLSYRCEHEPLEAQWWGCAEAFRLLDERGIASPVDRAIWAECAKVGMGVPP